MGGKIADELPDAQRQGVTVIRGCRKRNHPPTVAALHERVVIQSVVDAPGPRTPDGVLGH